MLSCEVTALAVVALSAIMALLGHAADRFSGTGFFRSLLPFAAGVLLLIVFSALFLIGWWQLRNWLKQRQEWLASGLALCLALTAGWFVAHDHYALAYSHFRTLVGGKQEAGRRSIAHQVYAAYRRQKTADLQKILKRAQGYRRDIEEAASAFDVDVNLLQGIAATESSFNPRDSKDGGRGLFQITQVPKAVLTEALEQLETGTLALQNHRHNAFVAAATFKHYLEQMNNDLFLALLAYNIGPANGGLHFIMQQYGASDFTTIQPYLQTLPRDYPIRVLSFALAFRLWQQEGNLPAYEEGHNAVRIQRIGIPGLQTEF